MNEIELMCLNCFNRRSDGSCKLPWVSTEEQSIRSRSGFCGDSLAMDINERQVPTSQIRFGLKSRSEVKWIPFIRR